MQVAQAKTIHTPPCSLGRRPDADLGVNEVGPWFTGQAPLPPVVPLPPRPRDSDTSRPTASPPLPFSAPFPRCRSIAPAARSKAQPAGCILDMRPPDRSFHSEPVRALLDLAFD